MRVRNNSAATARSNRARAAADGAGCRSPSASRPAKSTRDHQKGSSSPRVRGTAASETLLAPFARGRWRTPTSATSMPQLAGAGKHLRVDEEAAGLGQQFRQVVAAKDLEGTVHVPHSRPQQRSRQEVVAARQEAPAPRVLPVLAVADGDGVAVRQR